MSFDAVFETLSACPQRTGNRQSRRGTCQEGRAARLGRYRPQLLALEERLPPGDVVLVAALVESLPGPSLLPLDSRLAVGEIATKGVPAHHQAPAVSWEALTTGDAPTAPSGLPPGADFTPLVSHPTTPANQGRTALPNPETRNTSRQDASVLAAAAASLVQFPILPGSRVLSPQTSWGGPSEGTTVAPDLDRVRIPAIDPPDVMPCDEVQVEWVARYNGPGNNNDHAWKVALDPDGNVYVTGLSVGERTGFGYATVKYDADGNELWAARYNGPGNGDDWAQGLAIDAAGNVYVTGRSMGDGTGFDYATVKYDADGNELWVARYNGPGNGGDVANALAVNPDGSVSVTGSSFGGIVANTDYATIKYDSDGNELWIARYNGPGSGGDLAYALAVDSTGQVYVTGESYRVGFGSSDYATIKYDADGNEVWVARYNGPGNGSDWGRAVAVDADGSVYVTGESWGDGTFTDFATLRYDPDGNLLWVARYDGPANGNDNALALALDFAGNVHVAGTDGGIPSFDYATVKYDANGNQLWVARYQGPQYSREDARAMAVDAEGNVYVTGTREDKSGSVDYATVKYDADGNERWVAYYNGPGDGHDQGWTVAADGWGNIYVAGISDSGPPGYADFATIKYSQPCG